MTQEFLNVLFVGLAVNGIIIVALILAPAIRGLARRRTASRHAAAVEASGIRRPTGSPVDAGRPWFPDAAAGHATNGRTADDEGGSVVALPELASLESWRTWLAEESARTKRYRHPTTIVVVELSGIDRLAERVGPAAAQRLLPPVVGTLRRHARAADRLARLSPTRFGVLLVETDEVQAINYVERIRSGCDLWLAAGAVALRLSIGWAEIQADRPGEAAFLEAERRLYAERRRFEPSPPVLATDGRDGLTPALQTSGA
ncbi:MAG: diguanylate cyclase [Chloroflexota bacterium]|nr:diguanylate cyclase [Chloroflexota bacterium]